VVKRCRRTSHSYSYTIQDVEKIRKYETHLETLLVSKRELEAEVCDAVPELCSAIPVLRDTVPAMESLLVMLRTPRTRLNTTIRCGC
jgi:hypothetical protein